MASHPDTISAESVVPMSSILDALEGVLTEEERQALLEDLINVSPQGVAPGDLITAELFNSMLSDINSLKIRLANLEGEAGAPIISGVTPQGSIEIFSLVTLTGVNFNREYRNNIVRIGDTVIRSFRRGDEFSLAFNVPNEFSNLPATLPITLESDGQISNEVTITLVENVPEQDGNFDISTLATPTGVMVAGADIQITWQIAAAVLIDDTLSLELDVSNADGATEAEWRAGTRFSPDTPVDISPGELLPVTATISVPDDARAADLRLSATRQDGEVSVDPAAIPWRVGQTLEVSDPRAVIDFNLTGFANGVQEATIDVGGNAVPGLTFTSGGQAEIRFTLQDTRPSNLDAPADFQFSTTIETNPATWPITVGPSPSQSDVPAGDDTTFNILMNNSGGSTGDITFLRVEAQQTVTNSAGQLEPFTSFALIPIQRV